MLIDAHVHLNMYKDSLEKVLGEIQKYRIFNVNNSSDIPSYEQNLKISKEYDLIVPIFGVHPWNAKDYVNRLDDLVDFIHQSPMIGEIGLDRYFIEDASQYPAQQKVFEFFLKVAEEQDKIINVHTRGAEKEALETLNKYDINRTIIHWYTGPLDIFHEFVKKGVYFTIGVDLLYSDNIKTIAKKIPSEQLLSETDNPAAYEWLAGTPGMPKLIIDVNEKLAELRKTTVDDIVSTIQNNFIRLIRDDPYASALLSLFNSIN
jgi:TatD DNase family protein